MASMVFASSPLSAQSFVKLRINSNYSHPSCYVPRVKNSFVPLSYKNVSHIESSKSLFIKGDSNFSLSSPKFPRVASTYSPSLNIIQAITRKEDIYHYPAHDLKTGESIQLSDRYQGMALLIVNIPQQGNKWAKMEIEYLNDLRELYHGKKYSSVRGFEVLGFFHEDLDDKKSKWWNWGGEKNEIPEIAPGEENIIIIEEADIRDLAKFPIFEKVKVNDKHDNLWNFLRESKGILKIEHEFEKFLVDGYGKPIEHFIWYNGEKVVRPNEKVEQPVIPGQFPGNLKSQELTRVQDTIENYLSD